MNNTLKTQVERLREFLNHPNCKKFLVFLVFLSVSALFWTLQTLNETLEMRITLAMRLHNVPKEVIFTLPPQEEIKVTLQDKGTTLIKYLYKKNLKPLDIDFQKFYEKNKDGRVLILQDEIEANLKPQLSSSTRILKTDPDTVEIYYNKGQVCRLPVRMSGTIKTTPQNYIWEIQYTPDSVDLYAPSLVTDTMQFAYTTPINWQGLTESKQQTVLLKPIKGVRYQTEQVQVKVVVDYFLEKTIELPITGVGMPEDKRLKAFPSKAKVTFRVGANQIDREWEKELKLHIGYQEIANNTSEKYALKLVSTPKEISHVRIVPKEVEYLIETTDAE